MITSLCLLYFRFRRFIFFVQTKKVTSMNYGSSSRSSWKSKRWMRHDLILLIKNIFINPNLNPFAKCLSSSRSTEFEDIIPWNISKIILKTAAIIARIIISNVMKWGILLRIWWKTNENWDSNMIRISQWRESDCRTNSNIRRKN